jgi:hypothetical protein
MAQKFQPSAHSETVRRPPGPGALTAPALRTCNIEISDQISRSRAQSESRNEPRNDTTCTHAVPPTCDERPAQNIMIRRESETHSNIGPVRRAASDYLEPACLDRRARRRVPEPRVHVRRHGVRRSRLIRQLRIHCTLRRGRVGSSFRGKRMHTRRTRANLGQGDTLPGHAACRHWRNGGPGGGMLRGVTATPRERSETARHRDCDTARPARTRRAVVVDRVGRQQ